MSGHSKWANIKHRKEKTDSQKGKIFTKMGRELAMAVRSGGPDPLSNYALADAIAKAKAANMPNENIQRSIKKAAGDADSSMYEEVIYEGYGPGGIAVIVEAATDNRNRTASDVRHYFDKFGGNLGSTGCVSFMFEKKGVLMVERQTGMDEDALMMDALDAGAEDFLPEEEYFEITTLPENYFKVRAALEQKGYHFIESSLQMVPSTMTRLEDPAVAETMSRLIDHLEDLDDVQNVWHNWQME
ncbi:MAG TPA: YebC/PmpR family DNA-binding transcriptional regulator [Clostridiales bacterium]|nr:YebC/PmpR family DNA-binding transcriptional regulator [Clostridiales bacterium]